MQLSKEQNEIIENDASHLQVIACAGSGKTESISRRIARLISEGEAPESIVAFTFTEKSAAELKDRIYRKVEDIKGTEFLGRLGPMFVGTIHSYCFRVLQDHVPKYGNYDVLDQHRHSALVSRRLHELNLKVLHPRHWKAIELFLRATDVIGNELISLDELKGSSLGECYAAYLQLLDDQKLLTFGMISARTVELLQENETICNRVTQPLTHLVVDEYQDINPAQEKLIKLLTNLGASLCVVGDDDQAIYQWRGSDIGNILRFTDRYPEATTIQLETNRRSRPLIVDSANAFAQTIPDRLPKKMLSVRPQKEREVVTWLGETPESEAGTIAECIESLHDQGWRYQDCAVLFRSVRTSAPALIEALEARGIPFNCGGRTGLFVHPEINYFGELFAWMADFSWKDERFGGGRDASLDNAVVGLSHSFSIPKKDQAGIKKYFEDWKAWHAKGNRRVSLVGDYYQHLKYLGIEAIDPDTPKGSARLGAFARFSKILADYEHVTLRSRWSQDANGERVFRGGLDRGKSFWTGLANFMLHYAKESYEDYEGEEVHNLDAVSILTVHQAKGLEWPILFLPGLSNKRFPSTNAGRSQDWCLSDQVFDDDKRRRYEGGDADERRLFYVALTRGRDIVYASSFSRITRAAGQSPYLLELAASIDCEDIPLLDQLPLPDAPEQLKNPEALPLELGFSDLADYEDCGYSYRLGRVFGFERELAQELGYGNAVHHVLRHVAENARETGQIPGKAELDDLVLRELYVPFANEATFANMTRSVTRLVNSYVTDWQADLRRVWATERPFEVHFDGGILAGRADVILDQENGHPDHLAIVDYKTSTDADRDERYAKQLTIYAAAGRQEGLQVDACYVHELKSSDRKSIDASQAETMAAMAWAETRFGEIATGVYPARAEQNNCEKCDFKLVCTHTCVHD